MSKLSLSLLAVLLLTSCNLFKSSDLYVAVAKTQAKERSNNAAALASVHQLLLQRGVEHKIVKFRYDVAPRAISTPMNDGPFFRGQTPLVFAKKRRYVRERSGIIYRDEADLATPWWYVDGEVSRPIWLPPVRVAMQISFAMRRRIELLRMQEFDRAVDGMAKGEASGDRGAGGSGNMWNERFRRANGTDFDPASPVDVAENANPARRMSSPAVPGENAPRVSVVMCSFNPQAGFFREAIESVRGQSFSDWELLIVDNGTTNGSDAVALEYAEKFANIRFMHHPNRENKGPAASRNLGIRESRGTFVAFLDSDDLWLPEKLENQVAALAAHPNAGLCFGGILRWYGWDPQATEVDRLEEHTEVLEVLQPPEVIHRFLRNECIPGMSSLVVRKAASDAVGGFEESLLWAEDQTISYKIGLEQEVLILPGWDMKYRQHPHSTTTTVIAEGRLFAEHLPFLDWVNGYFKQVKLENADLWRELREVRRQYGRIVLKQKLVPKFLKTVLKKLRRR